MQTTSAGFGPRPGWAAVLGEQDGLDQQAAATGLLPALAELDLLTRSLVAILYNCVPTSGHPGGSISAGRLLQGLLWCGLDVDLGDPARPDADQIVLAAGHKALGLYAAWALRDEIARQLAPELLPAAAGERLRLEDVLGFRRNPTARTPLFRQFGAKALDGHPTPATPFVPLATGASGVGLAAGLGLAWAALDRFPADPPRVHLIEGEGGLTPGRVAEAMSAAASAGLYNAVLHVDWNQASIDSERVCRDATGPGDYVPWDPFELARFHGFNALLVEDGLDHAAVLRAQALVRRRWGENHQPTCIVYRTVKGWRYGLEGRRSHGAGHPCCSEDFYGCLQELERDEAAPLPRLTEAPDAEALEAHAWTLLQRLRQRIEHRREGLAVLGAQLAAARARLGARRRRPRAAGPAVAALYDPRSLRAEDAPAAAVHQPRTKIALRQALGRVLAEWNRLSRGAVVVAAADLAGSTSISLAAEDFGPGFYHAAGNPGSRLLAIGGICEDAMGAWLAAVSAGGHHIGAGASYGAFIAALQHVAARLHAIGQQARREAHGLPANPYLLICAHAGLMTGEDGPTHADPQCLQLLQGNFPPGALISLTPWDANELWPCLVAGLQARPAVLAPFVTRPATAVVDREALGLPPATAAARGLYALRRSESSDPATACVVLQGHGVTEVFVREVLPEIDRRGLELDVYCATSAELFERLDPAEQLRIFPEHRARRAMGITGFTLPTLYRWVTSVAGRRASLHPFAGGGYLGSGDGAQVLVQAGLDGAAQWRAVRSWIERKARED